jgi:hypothetical protein
MTVPFRAMSLAAALAVAAPASAAEANDTHIYACGTGVHAGEAKGLVPLPQGDLFCTLVADPKAIRTFASYLRGKFPTSTATIDVDRWDRRRLRACPFGGRRRRRHPARAGGRRVRAVRSGLAERRPAEH